jgi:hypothetical protein
LERRELSGHVGEIDHERGVADEFEPRNRIRRRLAGKARRPGPRQDFAHAGVNAATKAWRSTSIMRASFARVSSGQSASLVGRGPV